MSKELWEKRLRSYVPSWVFEKDEKSDAIFKGIAAVMSRVESDFRDHLRETSIDNSSEEILVEMGKERSIERISGESLPAYRQRVKKIKNRSNCPEIKEIVDNLLLNGEAVINEHENPSFLFCDADAFCDRGVIPTDLFYRAYTVIVPNQTPIPETFCNNANFSDNGEVCGGLESSIELFNQIISSINENRGFGIVYRLYERLG